MVIDNEANANSGEGNTTNVNDDQRDIGGDVNEVKRDQKNIGGNVNEVEHDQTNIGVNANNNTGFQAIFGENAEVNITALVGEQAKAQKDKGIIPESLKVEDVAYFKLLFKKNHLTWFAILTLFQLILYLTSIYKTWICLHREFFTTLLILNAIFYILSITLTVYSTLRYFMIESNKEEETIYSSKEKEVLIEGNSQEEKSQIKPQADLSAETSSSEIPEKKHNDVMEKRITVGRNIKKLMFGSFCCWAWNLIVIILLLSLRQKGCLQSTTKPGIVICVFCGVCILLYLTVWCYFALHYDKDNNRLLLKNFNDNNRIFHIIQLACLFGIITLTFCFTIQKLDREIGLERLKYANREHCRYTELILIGKDAPVRLESISSLELRVDELHVDEVLKFGRPIKEDVPFESILKLDEADTCKFTAIEGDEGSGKSYLAKKMCFEFAKNTSSNYYKAFSFVIYLSIPESDTDSDLKMVLLNTFRDLFVTYINPSLAKLTDNEIQSIVSKERFLIILDDRRQVSEGGKLVESFIATSHHNFPLSEILVLFNPPEILQKRLSCRYRLKGMTRENQHRIIDSLLGEGFCNDKVKTLIKESKPEFEEYLTPLLLAMLCHVCQLNYPIEDISDNYSILDRYVKTMRVSCGTTDEEFQHIVKHGYDLCIMGDKCKVREPELRKFLGGNSDKTIDQMKKCGFLFQTTAKSTKIKNRLYSFRGTLVLAGAVTMLNEKWENENMSYLERIAFLEANLRHTSAIPLGLYITRNQSLVCFFGSVNELIFCIKEGSKLEEGRMLMPHDVEYKYKRVAANPSYSLINNYFEDFEESIEEFDSLNNYLKADFDKFFDCKQKQRPIAYTYKRYAMNELFFRLEAHCNLPCPTKDVMVYAVDPSKEAQLFNKPGTIHAKYMNPSEKSCVETNLNIQQTYLDWINYVIHNKHNLKFYTLEKKDDPKLTVPNSYLQFTYENEQVFLAFYQFLTSGNLKIFKSISKPTSSEMPHVFQTGLQQLHFKFPNIIYGSRSFLATKP